VYNQNRQTLVEVKSDHAEVHHLPHDNGDVGASPPMVARRTLRVEMEVEGEG
jgi:hypothetical protein